MQISWPVKLKDSGNEKQRQSEKQRRKNRKEEGRVTLMRLHHR